LTIAATRLKKPVSVHQSHVRQKLCNHFGTDCVYWSGFMGDALAGVDLPKVPSKGRREAARTFINIEFTPNYKDQKFQDALVEKMFLECAWDRLEQSKLVLDRQLMLGIWQNQITRHLVLIDGFNFKTPFLSKPWLDFIIKAPYGLLVNKHLYKEIIKEGYRDLAKIGTTDYSAGMSLFHDSKFEILLGKMVSRMKPYIGPSDPYRSHPRTNYVNWAESLRHKGSLQDSVYTTLLDLKKRSILDGNEIDTWWRDHLNRKTDYARLLMNLSSLELLLKAGVMV
jgi:hypothetical protein